uniref:Uncharacterized protein n=1 Tax=Micrurus surinamensis TaxID=129470 RepID=A0A2D4NSG0_MICSU
MGLEIISYGDLFCLEEAQCWPLSESPTSVGSWIMWLFPPGARLGLRMWRPQCGNPASDTCFPGSILQRSPSRSMTDLLISKKRRKEAPPEPKQDFQTAQPGRMRRRGKYIHFKFQCQLFQHPDMRGCGRFPRPLWDFFILLFETGVAVRMTPSS